jgi:hypothetical protein
MQPSPTRRHELIGRMTREDAFIIAFWKLHAQRQNCPRAGNRHTVWNKCPLYVLRWGE